MVRVFVLSCLLVYQTVSDNRVQTSQKSNNQSVDAADFSLRNLNGRSVRLSDYRGKVVLVNLWATWCAPCLVEIPELVKLQRENKSRGLQILGVTFPDDTRASVRRMSQKFKLNYPVLLGDNKMLEAYEIGD